MTPAERLRERAAQLRAQADAAEGRARRSDRAIETRRKVLLGSWVMADCGRDLARMDDASRAEFDQYLTRKDDRVLFGLPPLAGAPSEKQTLDAGAASAGGSSAPRAGHVSTDVSGDTSE